MSVDDVRESGALLAYAMNGEPLPPRHGYPLRVVVPGWYGMASVKWLTELEVVAEPIDGYFQTARYVYEYERDGATVREPVGRQRVRSLITEPADGAEVELGPGEVVVRGVAWSGAAPIAGVDVRVDEGPWQPAEMVGEASGVSWQGWELVVRLDRQGMATVRSRATRPRRQHPAAAAGVEPVRLRRQRDPRRARPRPLTGVLPGGEPPLCTTTPVWSTMVVERRSTR